jgi:hypothetical protein
MNRVAAETPQPQERSVIGSFAAEFARLHTRARCIIEATPLTLLYTRPNSVSLSVGENVLRSAGAVEQTFGGLTANLWDDPFEWTLPETLSTLERVLEYLEEVEETRKRAFSSLVRDSDLLREISVPEGEPVTLVSLLLATMVRASEFQGRAIATLRTLAAEGAPGFNI